MILLRHIPEPVIPAHAFTLASTQSLLLLSELQKVGCTSGPCDAYIGLVKSMGYFSSWLDATAFGGSDYSNWDEREPNNRGGSENCAEIVQSTGKWNDVVCNVGRIAVYEKPRPADWCATGWEPYGQC